MNNVQTIVKILFFPKYLDYFTIIHPQDRASSLKKYVLFSPLFWLVLYIMSNFIASLKHQQFIAVPSRIQNITINSS